MKRLKTSHFIPALIITLFIITRSTQAGLIIDISNNNGYAQFNFSGSDIAPNTGNFNNGFWINGIIPQGMIENKGSNIHRGYSITSGAAGFSVNTEYFSFDDVWINHYNHPRFDGRIGFRNINAPIHAFPFESNTHIELSGSITTDLLFSELNTGSYSFDSFGANKSGTYHNPLTDGITINIGGNSTTPTVSEPAAFILFGLGLISMLGLKSRKISDSIN